MSIIERLSTLAHLTPDEIAARLNDPFAVWQNTRTMTRALFDAYEKTRIAICHRDYASSPDRAERNHRIGADHWAWEDWESGIFSSGRWWFRFQASYEANPQEGFTP